MTHRNAYRIGTAVAAGTALFLLGAMGALGIIRTEGDPADLMYLGVLAVGVAGAVVARFRPDGMVRAMAVTAAATVVVGVVALALGKADESYTSVAEILGLTAMFATMFAASAWLFSRAVDRGDVARS